MYEQRSYKTPGKVKLLIVGAAFAGLTLQVVQLVLFLVVFPSGDFLSPFGMWDKIEVTYDNRTNETAYVYLENRLEATVPAHQSVTVTDRKLLWWFGQRVQVRDASGRVLFAIKLDKDDLEDRGYRVVIEEQ
jgi:hypothetical protein